MIHKLSQTVEALKELTKDMDFVINVHTPSATGDSVLVVVKANWLY